MSLGALREEVVTTIRQKNDQRNFLRVVKSVPDVRRVMHDERLEFPLKTRFHPDLEDGEQIVWKLSDFYPLLTRAKEINGDGRKGKKLFLYRV